MSDKKRIPEGYSKLTVVVADSSNFYLDKVIAKNDSAEFKLLKDYDTVRKTLVYVYDSLRNNEYEITLASLLNRNFKLALTLVKDTVIFIDKSQLHNFDTTGNATNLLSGVQNTDTLCIAYASIGCFHNYSNRTLIYKNQNVFTAEFTTDTSHDGKTQQIVSIKRQLPTSFLDTLRKLELGCMEGFSKQQEIKKYCDKELSKAKDAMDSMRATMWLYSSTTSSAIYLNKGNKVFELTNNGINEIPFYFRFMNALKLE
jgi:hypothetical protein